MLRTNGARTQPAGETVEWELRQTYDAIRLAPCGYHATSSAGGCTRLALDGRRMRGVRRAPGSSAEQGVDVTINRPGFVASASDLPLPNGQVQRTSEAALPMTRR